MQIIILRQSLLVIHQFRNFLTYQMIFMKAILHLKNLYSELNGSKNDNIQVILSEIPYSGKFSRTKIFVILR